MVILPYIGLWENSNLSFHFQFPLNLTSTNTKVEHMLKANDIWEKNQRIACNTGVIHVIEIFTELPCSSSSSASSSSSSSSG